MGGKWSKSSMSGWPAIRERMKQAEPAADGVGAVSRDLEKHGAITSSNTAATNADCAWLEAQEEEEVCFPVRPQVPFYHTQGYFPDWQNYTPGPGTRWPLTFGWCFKLVPVEPEQVEEANEGENNSLLHPMSLHGIEDPEKEVLVWKFDSSLAFHHKARELHPEYYKDC
uniref:Protein Nef n=1 Tax=Human immunodeficiency virus type 1 TaxID=11676 RepID=Q79748_HV1|nr:nef protein [Human immunodeficiency virus 1]